MSDHIRTAEVIVTEQEKGASAHRIARDYFEVGNWHVATFFQNISAMHYERDRLNRGVTIPIPANKETAS